MHYYHNEVAIWKLTEDYNEKDQSCSNPPIDLNPPYSREYFYSKEEEEALISSLFEFEHGAVIKAIVIGDIGSHTLIIDGKQRLVALCRFVNNKVKYNGKYFCELENGMRKRFLDLVVTVCVCNYGNDNERRFLTVDECKELYLVYNSLR